LESKAAEAAATRARDADTAVREDQSAEVLVEEAATADMLVVGSRGHGAACARFDADGTSRWLTKKERV
jgi:nucleotide-binding universal stress UspA family protein